MKQTFKKIVILAALATAACRSSDYLPKVDCSNSSDQNCNPVVTNKIDPPKNLQAEALSANKIKITWSNPSYDGNFMVVLEMREHGTSAFSTVQVLDQTETSFDVSGLEPLTKYHFRIQAISSEDESEYTSEEFATTLEQAVNALFPKPTSTITHNTIGTIKITNTWSNLAYTSWVSSVQYQHKKEDGGEWETIAMGTYTAMSAMYIDNTPPHGYVLYRMIVTYTDQSVYTTAPSAHIVAVLETPTSFHVETTEVDNVTKHLFTWSYETIPNEMSGYEILGYLPNLTQVGPMGIIQASTTSFTHLPNPCPSGTQVSYWMRAKSNSPFVASSNVSATITKTCP